MVAAKQHQLIAVFHQIEAIRVIGPYTPVKTYHALHVKIFIL